MPDIQLPSFRAIYKVVNGQEVDAQVYLPPRNGQDATRRDTKHPVLINIHGGAFILGSSRMVNMDQVSDCLRRQWVVVAPNHRLCPQVNILEGPIRDCRDLLAWIYSGGLEESIAQASEPESSPALVLDLAHVFAFGTSSGGTLALSLAFDVPRPVAGIFDMYGPCQWSDPSWSKPLPHVLAKVPQGLSQEFLNKVYDEVPVPIEGGVSLEGQANSPPDFSDPRPAFAFTHIGSGTIKEAIFPSGQWSLVDAVDNVTSSFPPTFIVHGEADTMVPINLSRKLYAVLQDKGVRSGFCAVPGEDHTFAARMQVGSETWDLQKQGFDFLQDLLENQSSISV